MKIGTLTTGADVESEINLTYLPQEISFLAGTQLTGLKVEVLGEGVICDLDANGLSTIGKAGQKGDISNRYRIPLADGLVTGKNVVLTITNSAAQTPDIYAYSTGNGYSFVKSFQQKVFASSGIEVNGEAFDFISFTNGTQASDELNILINGITQKFNLIDLQSMNLENFAVQSNSSDYYILNDGSVEKFNYIPNADTVLYVVKTEPV